MPRYLTRSDYGGYWYDEEGVTATECVVTDREPRPTGLLDQHGHEIYAAPETVRFGFQVE